MSRVFAEIWGPDESGGELADFDKDWDTGNPDPVGSHPRGAGPFGTLDQAGNVWECCRDLWSSSAYAERDGEKDPVGQGRDDDEQALRVVRGGSWGNPAGLLRAAFRLRNPARHRSDSRGFRVCRSVPEHD